MGERIALHNATKKIGLYKGDKEGFLEWTKEIEVQTIIHSFSNANMHVDEHVRVSGFILYGSFGDPADISVVMELRLTSVW